MFTGVDWEVQGYVLAYLMDQSLATEVYNMRIQGQYHYHFKMVRYINIYLLYLHSLFEADSNASTLLAYLVQACPIGITR